MDMGTRRAAAAACGWTLCLATSAGAANDPNDMYRQLFGQEERAVLASYQRGDDAAFAAKLLKAAGGVSDSPKLQRLLYERAYDFGLKSKEGYATAAASAREMAAAAPEQKDDCDEKLLKVLELQLRATARAEAAMAAGQIVEHLVAMAQADSAAGKFADAIAHYRRAQATASQYRLPEAEVVGEAMKAALTRERVEADIAACRKLLAADSANQPVRRRLLQLLLVELDDANQAASMLPATVTDEATRTLVPLARKPLADLAEGPCLDLGGWYASLAKSAGPGGRPKMLRRARDYYQRYLDLHGKQDGPAYQAKMQLDRVHKQLDRYGPALAGGAGSRGPAPAGRGNPRASLVITEALRSWAKERDAMPLAEQLDALQKKLCEVNATARPLIASFREKDGRISNLTFVETRELASLTPLVGMQLEQIKARAASLTDLSPLKGMPLREANFANCDLLRDQDLTALEGMPLTRLDLGNCASITRLPALAGMNIGTLCVKGCKALSDIRGLAGAKLQSIEADGTALRDLKALKGTNMMHLGLVGCADVTSLAGVEDLPLVDVAIGRTGITSLEPLRGKQLQKFNAGGCTGLKDLSPLAGMPLKEVVISDTAVASIEPIRGAPLTRLHASNCPRLRDFAPVRDSLTGELEISRMPFANLECLRGMRVKRLIVKDCPRLTSLAGIEGMPLTSLTVSGCGNLADLKGIEDMPLEHIDLRSTSPRVNSLSAVTELRRRFPRLTRIEQ